jgi:hypothetical protein
MGLQHRDWGDEQETSPAHRMTLQTALCNFAIADPAFSA